MTHKKEEEEEEEIQQVMNWSCGMDTLSAFPEKSLETTQPNLRTTRYVLFQTKRNKVFRTVINVVIAISLTFVNPLNFSIKTSEDRRVTGASI